MSTATLERSDHDLVGAVRGGDDRAFEALYERYHRRIHGFVYGMVKDHGRAEDVTQEVFVAALRRMRATARPIAFKPWIYEIAKNACIDAFRRSRRAEEVSYDAADGLTADDHRRLAAGDATPDAVVAAKHELETLCGAFGGLSDAHHEILVMRELEGLSYREIGDRMGMSRPAVESTLFRARRRLTEEYGELVSGERCRRVQGIIASAADGALGARDARRLARHVAHCQPCRREALASGLDRSLIARPPVRRRIAEKVAAWLPLPAFLRRFAHLPDVSDQVAGWGKLAAGAAAVLAAGVGAGVGVQHELGQTARPPKASAHSASSTASPARSAGARNVSVRAAGDAGAGRAPHVARAAARHVSRSGASRSGVAPARPAGPTGGPAGRAPATSSTRSARSPGGGPGAGVLPSTTGSPVNAVRQTVQGVSNTLQGASGAVGGAVGGATGAVGGAVGGASGAVGGAVGGASGAVGGAVGGASGAVGGATGAVGGAMGALPTAPQLP